MKRFSFKMLAVAAAVCAVCWLGCGGGDNGNPADNSGNNNGNGNSGSLILGNDEAWVKGGSCASANFGMVFKSNGNAITLERNDGVWSVDKEMTWRIDGDKLMITNPYSGRDEPLWYEISNGTLKVKDDVGDPWITFSKCSGVTVGGQ